VSDLSQVYNTLSNADIIKKAKLQCKDAELEDMIIEMAATGKANALINRKEKTVDFDEAELQEQEQTLCLIESIEKQNVRIV
jgi:hypothetical protein